jgi:hypothetical protein
LEHASNNLNNGGAGFLFLTKSSQQAHRWSTHAIEIIVSGAKTPAGMFKLLYARFLANKM